jgi:hypothetical protein
MGAESSLFEECDFDEPVVTSKCTWTLRHGSYNGEQDVTVLSEEKENRIKWSLLQKNIKVGIPIYIFKIVFIYDTSVTCVRESEARYKLGMDFFLSPDHVGHTLPKVSTQIGQIIVSKRNYKNT